MRGEKLGFPIKERDKMKRKQREKRIAIALATGIIASNIPVKLVYAKTDIIDKLNSELELNINEDIIADNNIEADNSVTLDKSIDQEGIVVTLKDGTKIRAFKDAKNEIILQEFDAIDNKWIDKVEIGQVEIKEMIATDDGGYRVTYLYNGNDNYFKYSQAYDKNSTKIGEEEIVGAEILTEDGNIISLDLVVDENNKMTTIKSLTEEVIVEEFIPVFCDYIYGNHIIIFGEDSNRDTSILIVTASGKVINGDIIKESQYMPSEYTEIKSLGISEIEDEKFIISGYAAKGESPNKKDGFLIQFDKDGNRDSEVKIIPSSYSEKDDASINIVIKSESDYILIGGTNLRRMYINALDYVDYRPIRENLTLLSGKGYRVVEEVNKLRTSSDAISTFTVKSVSDVFEYDIATYENVQDVKLIPGNNKQLIVAVRNMDNSTDISIINTDDDAEVDENGEIVSKVVNVGKIQDSSGPIFNIDIKNIKVNSDGTFSVTTTDSSTAIKVSVNKVEAGTPIEVIKPQPPVEEEKPEEKPPVEEEKPEEKPPVEEENPEVIPPIENSLIVNVDNGEEIVFDITKPTDIKIISSKLKNKDIEYILVNGIKVTKTTIEGKLTRNISAYSTEEYFITGNGYITLSAKLFEDLNLDIKEDYNIGVGFADGSEITDLVKLSIVDSSVDIDNAVTPPIEDSGNISDNENTSDVGSNSTADKEEVNNVEETNNIETSELPNTGSAVSSGVSLIFAMISAFIGTVLSKKKK